MRGVPSPACENVDIHQFNFHSPQLASQVYGR